MSQRKINHGICYLRILLSYMVVYLHFGHGTNQAFLFLCMCAVPCFIMMAFFLTESTVLSFDLGRQARRLSRFAYPLLMWGAIALVICVLLGGGDKVTGRALLEQIFLGMTHQNSTELWGLLDPPLWFEAVMIYSSILFMVLFRLFSRIRPVYWISFFVLSVLAFEYSGIVSWEEFVKVHHSILLVPLIAVPYAGLGLLLARYRIYERLAQHRKLVLYGCTAGVGIMVAYHSLDNFYLFMYGGGQLFLTSFLIFTCFHFFPEILPGIVQNFLMLVSKYSMGIYCAHWIVGRWMSETFPYILEQFGGWGLSAGVYAASFLVVLIIGQIRSPLARNLVC